MTMGMFFWVKKVVPALIVAADGSGDFTTIQAAIDALPATGGEIHVKAGTYAIIAQIIVDKSNVSIIGAGMSTIISSATAVRGFIITALTDFYLANMHIEVTTAGGVGIRASNCDRVTIAHCRIIDSDSVGVEFISVTGTDLMVRDCIIEATKVGVLFNEVNGGICSGNIIRDCTNVGIGIDTGVNVIISDNIVVDTTAADGEGDGISMVRSIGNIIKSNTVTGSENDGVNILGAANEGCIVVGNTLTGNGGEAINDTGTDTQIGHNVT